MYLNICACVSSDLNYDVDSTIYLLREAKSRGHNVYLCETKTIYYNGSNVALRTKESREFFLPSNELVLLNDMDIVLLRQDPPFNMKYLTVTYLLDHCGALVINSPSSIRDWPEKICRHTSFMLPTIITDDLPLIEDFFENHKDVVLKPLYDCGGKGVIRFNAETESMLCIAATMISLYNAPIVVQKFCSSVLSDGDKRVIMLDGKVLGCIKRVNPGNVRTGLCGGGIAKKTSLTDYEKELCEEIGSSLSNSGIILAGLDIIGEKYLTEINVTSPTGLVHMSNLYNINYAKLCFDLFEEKLYDRS